MNFEELNERLFSLDEHEKLRMELIEKNGKEIYLTDNRLNSFNESMSNRVEAWRMDPEKEEQLYIRKNKRFMKCHQHSHNYIEFVYVYSGIVKHIIKGKEVEIKTGEICILDRNIKHATDPANRDDIGINIVMTNEFFDSLFMSLLAGNDIISKFIVKALYSKKGDDNFLMFHCGDNENIQYAMKKVMCEWYSKNVGYETSIKGLMLVIFTELMRNYHENLENKTGADLERTIIHELTDYLNKNYRTTDLKMTATYFNFNSDYLSKVIKGHIGASFIGLLQEIKLQKSCDFLKKSDLSIEEIADEVGYSNVSYFYRVFKKKYNQTPLEYRNGIV